MSSKALVVTWRTLHVARDDGWSAGVLFAVVVLAGGVVSAAPAEQPATPSCLTAEVNPVTGHVLCIEPLGAAVEPRRRGGAALQEAGRGEGPVELQPELHA